MNKTAVMLVPPRNYRGPRSYVRLLPKAYIVGFSGVRTQVTLCTVLKPLKPQPRSYQNTTRSCNREQEYTPSPVCRPYKCERAGLVSRPSLNSVSVEVFGSSFELVAPRAGCRCIKQLALPSE